MSFLGGFIPTRLPALSHPLINYARPPHREFASRAFPFSPLLAQRHEWYRSELLRDGSLYGNYPGQKPVLGPEVERNLHFYNIGARSSLPIVLGPSENVWLPSMLVNFGGASEIPFVRVFKGTKYIDATKIKSQQEQVALTDLHALSTRDQEHLKTGSIMFEAFWTPAINYSFVKGAIDADQDLHLAVEARTLTDLKKVKLYDVTDKRITAFAGELLSAANDGYRFVPTPLEPILVAPKHSRSSFTKLKDQLALFDGMHSANDVYEGIAEMFERNEKS